MTGGRAGERVKVAITWLEMPGRPEGPYPPLPTGPLVSLIRAEHPPVDYFLYLYDHVGRHFEWTDRHQDDPEALRAFLHDPDVSLFSMLYEGWPAGFFLLDWREDGVCELAYFGISSEVLGQGYGKWLLGEAVRIGWDRAGVDKMTVNTCSLDHPRALPMYQRMGFEPVRRTEIERVLTQDMASRE
jgi:GNAT superfamily N-acetyltransferase